MRCAIFAPSATNEQPWEVRVIHKPGLLTVINERWKKTAPKKILLMHKIQITALCIMHQC